MEIKIGNKYIGDKHPVFFIGEIGINHNGDIDVAKKLIDVAVEAKCDAVKFQKRDLNELYLKKLLLDPNLNSQGLEMLISLLRETELSNDDFRELKKYCDDRDVLFLCSAWDKPSVDFLESVEIPAYKISSADLTNIPLLEYIISKNKPIILSTGMVTLDEVKTSVELLHKKNAKFVLMHCVSVYPAQNKDLNIRFIQNLKEKFNVIIGYSGHEQGIAPSLGAVALGAKVIERHITLDKKMKGRDQIASLEPNELKQLILLTKEMEPALGNEKNIIRGEIIIREELSKSLVANCNIKKGEVIKKNNICVKGPAKGISPQYYYAILGKVAKRDIAKESYFLEEDLKD